jgi:ubiquinone/menaquinone biosynthesis C-methylase UbiE
MDKIVNYYNDLAESYDYSRFGNSYGNFIDRQERIILDKLLTNNNEIILDLACGSGRLLNYANFGVDASPKMIKIAEKKFDDKVFYVSEADKTPFEDNSIDTIMIFHLFMHLDKDKLNGIFTECHRILKGNGRIIFDIPSSRRRKLLKFNANEWHGSYSSSFVELEQEGRFVISQKFGFLFLPMHRFPIFLRKFLVRIDLVLANSFLKEYSSYLIIEYRKILC